MEDPFFDAAKGQGSEDDDDDEEGSEDDDEFNVLEGFEQCINEMDRPGDFAVGGSTFLPQPLLSVAGVDDALAWPLPSSQAAQLKQVGVRDGGGWTGGWSVPHALIRVGNRVAWDEAIGKVLREALEALGVSVTTKATLSQLVLHDACSTGDPDSLVTAAHGPLRPEGLVFGAFVVSLPAAHAGGQLTVRHGAQSKTFDASSLPAMCLQSHWSLFYTSCAPALSRLDSGCTLRLVYEVTQPASSAPPLRPPCRDSAAARLAKLARKWEASPHDSPPKLVYYLSESELLGDDEDPDWDTLSGADAALRDTLLAVKAGAGGKGAAGGAAHRTFDMFLVVAKVSQTGTNGIYDEPELDVRRGVSILGPLAHALTPHALLPWAFFLSLQPGGPMLGTRARR